MAIQKIKFKLFQSSTFRKEVKKLVSLIQWFLKIAKKTFNNIYLIVETKRKDKKDGIKQLKSYVDPSPAKGGVWFNGTEIVYVRAIRKPLSYTPELVEWRNIPPKRSDLADSLLNPDEGTSIQREKIKFGTFDVLLTNPPFGSKISITSKSLLEQYELGFKWKRDKKTGKWERTDKVLEKQVPQILFIERCLQLLKPGGRMAIKINDLNITPYYLIYLLINPMVQRQIDDKVFIETTLPNISDRWKRITVTYSQRQKKSDQR